MMKEYISCNTMTAQNFNGIYSAFVHTLYSVTIKQMGSLTTQFYISVNTYVKYFIFNCNLLVVNKTCIVCSKTSCPNEILFCYNNWSTNLKQANSHVHRHIFSKLPQNSQELEKEIGQKPSGKPQPHPFASLWSNWKRRHMISTHYIT